MNASHSNFINNTATTGGAIYTSINVNVNSSIFVDNNADYGKAIYYYNNYICDSNFWGVNFENETEFIESSTITKHIQNTNVAPNNWIVMNITGPDLFNDITEYNVTLNKLNNGSDLIDYLPDFIVDISTSNGGSVNPTSLMIHEGSGTFTYTPGANKEDTIIASYNNENIVSKYINSSTILEAEDMITSQLSGELPNMTLKDINNNVLVNKPVSLTLFNSLGKNKTYNLITNEYSLVQLPIQLISGNYTILGVFPGDASYNRSNITVKVSVNNNLITTNIKAENITVIRLSGENFTATLKDSLGNVLIDKKVKLTLYNILGDSKVYWITTNTRGEAKLLINLNYPSVYTIESYYPAINDTVYRSSNIVYTTITVNNKTSSDLKINTRELN